MQVKDGQVFLVSGYTGQSPALDTLFAAQIIAIDQDDAMAAMREVVGDLTITGTTSLADLKKIVAMMEKVKSGEISVPVSEAYSAQK